jgi:glycosyltransferase involved in cell wall biosynthesis
LNSNFKHIVFLTPGFAQNEQDTTTIPAIQLYIKALKKHQPDLKITIISFQFPFTNEKYKWFGCDVIPLKGRNSKWKKIFIWNKVFTILNTLNKENPISILHSFWLGECAFVGNVFSKKNSLKHICTLMGQDVLRNNYYLKVLPIQKMNLICVSDFQQKQLYKSTILQTKIIPWGIHSADFSYPTTKTIDIIGVGSLIRLKNYELFIDVIFEINKIIPIKVVLIGDGIQKEYLEEKIKKLQLENTISLKGLLPYNETLNYTSQSKILLHTSNYESFGMIFAEALQCKTRIVSKEVGCAFAFENWHICSSKDEMIAACLDALSIPFSENFELSFTVENTVKNYLKIYNE